MLQSGLNYKTVVEPRVIELQDKYPESKTTSGFLKLIKQRNLKVLLRWKDSEKTNRILDVINLFVKEGIETENDLRLWLKNQTNITKLASIRGIKDKTIDYFRILSGIPSVAIDRHLNNFLSQAGIGANSYSNAKEVIKETADQLKINKSTLDYSIWKYMSTKKTDNSCEHPR